jgi:alkylhydroperoxidase/carboxymuconolactone decarboxylase family protein YurZ
MKDLVISILELEKIVGRYKGDINKEVIEIIFDDSIVIDDEAIDTKYKELNASGMLASWRVVSRVLKISETEAKEIVTEAELASVAKQAAFVKAYDEEPNDD